MRLNLRNKRKKRLPVGIKEALLRPISPNVTPTNWSLNIIDDFNREILSICVDTSLPSSRVIRELNQLIEWRGKPERIRVDNGPEFIAQVMKDWCEDQSIELTYIQPGKPTQNSLVERFNRTFRQEVLDCFIFSSIKEVKLFTQSYNLTPHEFLLKYGKLQDSHPGEFPTFQQDKKSNSEWKS